MATKKTTALANWDEELAKAARASKNLAAQAASAGSFISIKGGVLQVDGNPVPGNALACVVADFVLENKFYTTDFDADTPSSPDCYAFGRDLDEMGPHDNAEAKQHETCKGCPQNEWGSSDRGRGKACRNTYKLLVMPAGMLDAHGQFEVPETVEDLLGDLHSLSVPPTSLKAFAGYVTSLAGNLRPPWACYTKIVVKPDPKNQVVLCFEPLGNAPTELLTQLRKRHEEAVGRIETPYPKNSEREAPAPKARGKKKRF